MAFKLLEELIKKCELNYQELIELIFAHHLSFYLYYQLDIK